MGRGQRTQSLKSVCACGTYMCRHIYAQSTNLTGELQAWKTYQAKKNERPGEKKNQINFTNNVRQGHANTHTHKMHPRTERHMHAHERPCVCTDTRLHVAQSSQRDGCNSPRLGRADAESPRNTEEDEEMLLEGEDKPVGETKEGDTKAVVLRANKKAIHDRYVVTRSVKDTMTGKWTCSHMHVNTRRLASITHIHTHTRHSPLHTGLQGTFSTTNTNSTWRNSADQTIDSLKYITFVLLTRVGPRLSKHNNVWKTVWHLSKVQGF